MTMVTVVSFGLLVLVAAGCAREVTPGIQDLRTRRAEADRQARDVDIERYHAAARASEVGRVTGRVYEERRKPDGPDTPLTGTVLMLLPRSDSWVSAVETIRARSRESLDRYREAAPALSRARQALERALLERGGGDLAQSIAVAADGTFTIPDLPAGDWVLLAAHTEPGKHHDPAKVAANDPQRRMASTVAERFLPRATLVGHDFVTLWLREITVKPGAAETVTLTDRNAWMTAVVEDREMAVFRPSPPVSAPGQIPGAPGAPGTSGASPTLSPSR